MARRGGGLGGGRAGPRFPPLLANVHAGGGSGPRHHRISERWMNLQCSTTSHDLGVVLELGVRVH